jgi:hypothetical protein
VVSESPHDPLLEHDGPFGLCCVACRQERMGHHDRTVFGVSASGLRLRLFNLDEAGGAHPDLQPGRRHGVRVAVGRVAVLFEPFDGVFACELTNLGQALLDCFVEGRVEVGERPVEL